ncbi:hypothetical protein [Bradyrhizobium sp.]|uniref:hypothetical protein n=1 Tax=Bradyrhizobium sp. TaxID=376 RepID=UPI002D5D3992|nr:hypothetical protein [Bradyrhizobium sp.]HZR71314.1 hypothetical protein [Bradyrhizobium sp.]
MALAEFKKFARALNARFEFLVNRRARQLELDHAFAPKALECLAVFLCLVVFLKIELVSPSIDERVEQIDGCRFRLRIRRDLDPGSFVSSDRVGHRNAKTFLGFAFDAHGAYPLLAGERRKPEIV